ncbi:MAG TPA: FAD-binding oxidoreductase [Holophaga sp.]|nr:FAD-binding oxidoreductase [Holophaga sp.]HPS68603.1 FAD-binding oxidoreductase [Holophaga sp.]
MDALASLPDATVLLLPEQVEPFRHDESHLVGPAPLAVAKPRSARALRELVRLAKAEGFGLVARGAGTGKAGGCVPMARTVVVGMEDFPGTVRISRADMTLSAPASTMLKDVKGAALAEGLFYPPDPNSWDQCSFGGSLATNAGGPCACKYGMTRHWVLSVDALMDDGEVHTFGIPTVKNNAGPNLAQLLVGSEGIFGIILGATVRVIPRPRQLLTLLLPVSDWHALLGLPAALVGAGYLPSAFEFWDPAVLREMRTHGPEEARRMPGEALALLEFDDPGCHEDSFLEGILEVLGPEAEHLQSATDARQREALWAVRRLTSVVLKEQFPRKVSEDIVVPRSQVRAFFEGAAKLPLVAYGHLGDGNLHVNFLAAGDTEPAALERQLADLFRLCLGLGGTLTGEHGIGLAKRDAFLALADPYQVEALRRLKQALDPSGIFNPGKVI